jgi:hypothetical protein
MTQFTVVWDSDVEAAFISYWIAGDSHMRAVLTEAANWIDVNLSYSPDTKGQDRPDLGARLIAVPVTNTTARISAVYEVRPEHQEVCVIRLTFRGA